MTKLIDSLCGVNRLKGRNRVQDSYNDVSPEKVAKAKEFIKEEADRPEDALYEVMDYLYEAPVAIDTDRDILDVESKGALLAPDTLESFVREMDESHGISITGGSHFEGEDRLNYLREKAEALKKEVDKLEADPNSDADKLAAKKAMYLDAKNLYEKVKKSGSKVSDAAYNPKFEKLRKVLSDTTIVEELSHYMSSDELEEFTETLTRNYDIDLEEVEDSAK